MSTITPSAALQARITPGDRPVVNVQPQAHLPVAISIRAGTDGREIELQTSATHIQWRYEGVATWTNLIALSALIGDDGASVELQTNATHIQWRQVGAATWTDLIALSLLSGTDGREIELQTSATHIQWRYEGVATWTNLIALSDITGPAGDPATDDYLVANVPFSTSAAAEIVCQTITIPAGWFDSGDWGHFHVKLSKTGSAAGYTFKVYLNTAPNLSGSPVQIAQYNGGSTNRSLWPAREFLITSANTMRIFSATTSNLSDAFVVNTVPDSNLTVPFTSTLYLIVTIANVNAADSVEVTAAHIERKKG